jgi:hypothetical protein
MMLNIGCGSDYRDGFVNVDGSTSLLRVDKTINIPNESLLSHFKAESCEFILAQDVVEHLHRWVALELIKEFYALLVPQGTLQIRVPDTEYIIRSWRIPLERKISLLYGGQDLPQGGPASMEASRKRHPELFCHKYGWTKDSIALELRAFSFEILFNRRIGTNIEIKSQKR